MEVDLVLNTIFQVASILEGYRKNAYLQTNSVAYIISILTPLFMKQSTLSIGPSLQNPPQFSYPFRQNLVLIAILMYFFKIRLQHEFLC
jgi:hypothetical protein